MHVSQFGSCKTGSRAPIAVFFHLDLFFESVGVWGVAQRRRCLRGMPVVACRDAGFPKRYQRGSLVVV